MANVHSLAANTIGHRIRLARKRRGLSLEELGELSQINWTTIGKIERGASSPTVETLVRIATALQFDAGSFLTGIGAAAYDHRPNFQQLDTPVHAGAAKQQQQQQQQQQH